MLNQTERWYFINAVEDFAKKNGFRFPMCLQELKACVPDDEDIMKALVYGVWYIIEKMNKES